MYHMKRATLRDLRYNFAKVEAMLAEGEDVEVTRHKRVIARLTLPDPEPPIYKPDFLARMKEIFGDKVLEESGADIIRWDRYRDI